MAKKPKTTTRSYTLGLLAPSEADDWLSLWKRLFRTHRAICRGAREFGEFYLNLRGGLPASLATPCDEDNDEKRRRLLQRGVRRMLALGWLSVEDFRGAENHPYRVRELQPGESLSKDLAERLLRDILRTCKGVSQESELAAWVDNCIQALTAKIRTDAVIVNRAASFAAWQATVEDGRAEMPEQAQRILFTMCGSGFVSLTLPDEAAVETDEEELESDDASDSEGDAHATSKSESEEVVEPSNASRGVFGDLFGGSAAEKLSRAAGKEEFAVNVRKLLVDLGDTPPTRETIITFRSQQGLPDLDITKPDKYPAEVTSSGAPTAVAKRYRKLLVYLGLWPKSNVEDGTPRTQAGSSFKNRITATDEHARLAQINSLDLINACPKPEEDEKDSQNNSSPQRVFTPSWADGIAARVADATGMPANARSLNEFKRLMFALAARRISQTQSWTKRNEIERHKAAVKEDAAREKLNELDADERARTWLTAYEDARADRSGAITGFRVTKRMVGECDVVFNAWATAATTDERDEKTASIQAEAEKFGDPTFYADISADPAAEVIWQHTQGAEILHQWVKLRQAQHDQQRFKIPRFCHPDPFHHPTWCEFGGSSKPKVWYSWNPSTKPQKPEPGGNGDGTRRLWMLLPNFESNETKAVPMRWRCKRLSRDLGGVNDVEERMIPRADRLSKAAANLPLLDKNGKPIRYRPSHPFGNDAKGWNARLQLDRATLEELEKQWDDKRGHWLDEGRALRNARWFVTFAPTLAASEGLGRTIHPKLGWMGFPHAELNKKQKREDHAKLILSRLPGLRVLSVDLGHRYAAACAVWEAMTREGMCGACGKNGHAEPRASDLFIHLTRTVQKQVTKGHDKGKTKSVVETTVYRRIGADTITDPKTGEVSPHPAPWARLDRQFLIKLSGEEQPARAASNKGGVNEVAMVAAFARRLGLNSDDDREKGRGVDRLMSRAVHIATLGLKRHARRAKIAYALDPATKAIPGMGGSEKAFTVGDDDHIKFLADTLFDWYALASDSEWDDKAARDLWNQHMATNDRDFHIPDPQPVDASAEQPTRQQRRKKDDALREGLKPLAQRLATTDRMTIHAAWRDRWVDDDGTPALDDGTSTRLSIGWYAELRRLTDWIMGRRLPGATNNGWRENVGGLSLTRIATMKSLHQLHKAFAMRAKPDKPRGAPEKGESNAGVAQSILDAMEKMREQRVKQIASRIVEAALGVGIERERVWDDVKKKWRYPKRPRGLLYHVDEQGVAHGDPRFKTCHAVVIENLTNYRPEETRTRRENRQLMSWSSSKVKKYLSEGCQLYGLHLREVQANYTSQQDSRTGAPGMRCADVPVHEFMTARWWRKQINAAKKKRDEKKGGDARDRYLLDLDEHCGKVPQEKWKDQRALRIPNKGGEVFVSANPHSAVAKGLQADLNAAANIGLRALLDPDFLGKWWYMLCDSATGQPAKDKCAGAACLDFDKALLESQEPKEQKRPKKKSRSGEKTEKTNAWRDVGSAGEWRVHAAYWNDVKARVVARLRAANGLNVPYEAEPLAAADTRT